MNNEKKAPVRQIKFRGLRVDGKGWVYGYVFVGQKSKKTIILEDGKPPVEVKPETIGQFTGRLDINGVEIYEGDKVLHGESERFVEWRWTNFVLTTFDVKGCILLSFSGNPKVYGNIHQESEVTNG